MLPTKVLDCLYPHSFAVPAFSIGLKMDWLH